MPRQRRSFGSRRSLGLGLPEEVLDQERNVIAPFSQGGHAHGDDVEPIVEVFTELAGGNQLLGVLLDGDDKLHVDRDDLLATEPAELAPLEDGQGGRSVP